MRKSSSKRVALKYRRVIIHFFSLYDGRIHRKIFKDCTLSEALTVFYAMAVLSVVWLYQFDGLYVLSNGLPIMQLIIAYVNGLYHITYRLIRY